MLSKFSPQACLAARILAKRLLKLERSRPPCRLVPWASLLPESFQSWLIEHFWITREERALRKDLAATGPLAAAYYLTSKWSPHHPETILNGIMATDPALGPEAALALYEDVQEEMVGEWQEAVFKRIRAVDPAHADEIAEDYFVGWLFKLACWRWGELP